MAANEAEEVGHENDWIQTRADFVTFVDRLLDGLKSDPSKWENRSLEAYLSALAIRAETIDSWYKTWEVNKSAGDPSWSLFADLLSHPTVYDCD